MTPSIYSEPATLKVTSKLGQIFLSKNLAYVHKQGFSAATGINIWAEIWWETSFKHLNWGKFSGENLTFTRNHRKYISAFKLRQNISENPFSQDQTSKPGQFLKDKDDDFTEIAHHFNIPQWSFDKTRMTTSIVSIFLNRIIFLDTQWGYMWSEHSSARRYLSRNLFSSRVIRITSCFYIFPSGTLTRQIWRLH